MVTTRRFILAGIFIVVLLILIGIGPPGIYKFSLFKIDKYESKEVLNVLPQRDSTQLHAILNRPVGTSSRPSRPSTAESKAHASSCLMKAEEGGSGVWSPQENKFVVALCVYGQSSNQAWCLRNYLLVAATLQRTLIIPTTSTRYNYKYTLMLDPEHARSCYGNSTIISEAEYLQMFPASSRARLVIEELYCWYTDCALQGEFHTSYWPDYGFPAKSEWKNLTAYDASSSEIVPAQRAVEEALYSTADVISLGDLFGLHVQWLNIPRSRCSFTLPPDPIIMSTVNGFVQNILGANYMAAHIRRSDWLRRNMSHPILDVADCLAKAMIAWDLSVLFLATDAAVLEIQLLTDYISRYPAPRPLSVVMRPSLNTAESHRSMRWASDWWSKHYDDLDTAKILFEKLVCALSDVLITSKGSTFSADIIKWRQELGKRTCADGFVCENVPRRQAAQLELVVR